jgi:hypothetical protein
MSETIDAIQERLRPGRLVSDAAASFKAATLARARRVVNAIKAKPVPFVIAGAAAAAFLGRAAMRSRRRSRRASQWS